MRLLTILIVSAAFCECSFRFSLTGSTYESSHRAGARVFISRQMTLARLWGYGLYASARQAARVVLAWLERDEGSKSNSAQSNVILS